ncbi:glutamate-1-semialdehyde 2,1-aminomutase [Thermorudis peleae]|uniref:glutamate-1-semialdehyde 2,1-aminomutase n=1 Tax=Thermorudis peleae TaxID=1382356 RepID=UPI000570CADF|nr:glutamate-1-semialdehyde 2,1-aminomutase [Thermorudis peleae]
MLALTRSTKLWERAQQVLPGGVNSPVRAFRAVGGTPPFIVRGQGAILEDADGNHYLDYICSWGALIAGHAHPAVVDAVCSAAAHGTSFGAPTPAEVELAELVCSLVPSIEQVRFVNSGTEATMSAIRLARAATGRSKIVKFSGCYHGHADALLATAGSGVLTLGLPGTPGVPSAVVADTISLPYNLLDPVRQVFAEVGEQIAAVIVEPVAGNIGVVPPEPGFLEGLRELTAQHGALLIFDEVITGFRLAPGGAQERYGIMPDLTCLGKIVGGGLPVGAYGGRRDLMSLVAPSGPVYQAGTLSGNPLAMAAGLATLRLLQEPGLYERLDTLSQRLAEGLRAAAAAASLPITVNQIGSMLTVFFTPGPVVDEASAKRSDTAAFARFHRIMLESGIMLPPSQFEAWFVSLAHTEADIERTIEAAGAAFRACMA